MPCGFQYCGGNEEEVKVGPNTNINSKIKLSFTKFGESVR